MRTARMLAGSSPGVRRPDVAARDPGFAGPGGRSEMRVLRLCSVFETPDDSLPRSPDLDPVGGMQVHTARLTRALDARGIEQLVVTAYRRHAPREERIGERSTVVRTG